MVFPRGLALLIGAVLTVAACQVGEQPSGLSSDGLALAAGGKVFVCHFPGHEITEEGAVVFSDYATKEAPAPPGSLSRCGQEGGNVIKVSIQSCINGHVSVDPDACLVLALP
jgi:hypothetical protein